MRPWRRITAAIAVRSGGQAVGGRVEDGRHLVEVVGAEDAGRDDRERRGVEVDDLRSKRIVLTRRGVAAVGVIRDAVTEMEAAWAERPGRKCFTQLRNLLLELRQPAGD